MKKIRIIARLDIKNNYVVKGIQMEGLRKIGNPNELAKIYYKEGIDEIIYLDTVASLYNRNNLSNIVKNTTKDIFIPITVGGGLRSTEDIRKILNQGADKITINTEAIKRPEVIREVSKTFGSQCMVLSVQAKRISDNRWEAYYDNGREHSGRDVIEWIKQTLQLGVGEILLTSVDKDGTQTGMDYKLIEEVCKLTNVPVIASGGIGQAEDVLKAVNCGASGVAIASMFHYKKISIYELKAEIRRLGLEVHE